MMCTYLFAENARRYSTMHIHAKDIRRYALSTYLRSTAVTLIPMPLWWILNQHISLSTYLSGMATVGIIGILLDLPTSILADRFQPKVFLQCGCSAFICAFLCAALCNGPVAFLGYLSFSTLAGALFSGADNALLVSLVGDKEFGHVNSKISKNLYWATILLIPLGAFSYLLYPSLPLYLQAVLLCGSFIALSPIDSAPAALHSPHTPRTRNSMYSAMQVFYPSNTAHAAALCSLFLVGGIAETVISHVNRTFQLQVIPDTTIATPHVLGISVIAFCTGNLLSGFSSALAQRQFRLHRPYKYIFSAVIIMLIVGLGAISYSHPLLLIGGYLLIALAKGIIRPMCLAFLQDLKPLAAPQATWFSLYSFAGAIISACLIWSLSVMGNDVLRTINFGLIAALFLCCVLILCAIKHSDAYCIHTERSGFSAKKSAKKVWALAATTPHFVQSYRDCSLAPVDVARCMTHASLAHPTIISTTDEELEVEHFPGITLNNASGQQAYDAITAILRDYSTAQLSPDLPQIFLGPADLWCGCGSTVVHGDLHPENILVDKAGHYVAVDWDLSHHGSPVYDVLLLLSHPRTPLAVDQRISLLKEYLEQAHNDDCVLRQWDHKALLSHYMQWKITSIEQWDTTEETSKAQEQLLREYRITARLL
ncbi:MFS transporter [Corynebacterium sp. sy017]|nr:MFS transporter [Corynebacterium sp. sy017]